MRRPVPTLGLTARMLVCSGVLGAVVVTAFAVLLVALGQARDAAELAERAHRVDAVANELERRVVDLESAHRGFAVTGDESFLEPWRDAHVALPRLRSSLRTLIVDPAQAVKASALLRAIDAYVAEWSRPSIELARRDLEAARRRIAGGEGKRRMDALRAQFEAFGEAEQDLVVTRTERADHARDSAVVIALVGLGGSCLLVLAFALYLSRSVVRPTLRLAAAADRISHGDLAARVDESGAAELGGLERGFNHMAESVESTRGELERQQEELRQLDRLKDEFVATVSHELRTPLTSMIGFLEILQEPATGDLSDDQRNFLEIVARNADRLTRLVGDLLFVARLDSGRLELDLADLDAAALLAEAVASARATALHRGVRLELEASHGLARVVADGARLRQLLDNLISNALKFTAEGGRVVVRGRVVGGLLRVEVEDTGIGIPADEVGRLAERFFRASSATAMQIPGTGLGLAISKAIAAAHGGSIDVVSELGVGTTFTVELPAAAASAAAA